MRTILLVLVMLCLAVGGFAQQRKTSGQTYIPGKIYIDSRLPDIPLGKFIRYKDSTAKLSNFFNKIIILDFWFTQCTACIEQFPKEDSLQRIFSKDIQIIPVAHQSKKEISGFLEKWETTHHTKLSMPFIVEDTLLNKCFANAYFPHYVWIGQDRHIMGMTSENFITQKNIEAIIKETAKIKKRLAQDPSMLDNVPHLDMKQLANYQSN